MGDRLICGLRYPKNLSFVVYATIWQFDILENSAKKMMRRNGIIRESRNRGHPADFLAKFERLAHLPSAITADGAKEVIYRGCAVDKRWKKFLKWLAWLTIPMLVRSSASSKSWSSVIIPGDISTLTLYLYLYLYHHSPFVIPV